MPEQRPEASERAAFAQLEQERDLYLRLLDLGRKDDISSLLQEALQLVTRVVDAHQGYLEMGPGLSTDDAPRWWAAHGFSENELAAVRRLISRGIIAQAICSGQTIATRSALEDERFEARRSVRNARIEAVLCAPIGGDHPIGVLYLQRRNEPGAFSEADRARIETIARYLTPFADRLYARSIESGRNDPTLPFRAQLRLDSLVGHSARLATVLREVTLVSRLDVDVLLTGESGTGKSQIARVIHDNSPRATRPFVELNCAAIPETLIESELFGSAQGAHSTALRPMDGKIIAAQGGTLFLDEIGELALSAQAKLLQLLQARTFYPLGSARLLRADLRVLAATNTNLETAVAEGRFRQDLFYRLSVLPIRMPTLAERREDIEDLARYFCNAATERHRLPRVDLSPQLVEALVVAEWPGNVRQLGHAIEAAAIRASGSGRQRIERAHLFPDKPAPAAAPPERASAAVAGATFQEATRRFQAQLVRETLEDTGWNIVEASRRLEIARSHLYTLIRALGIERSKP